MRNGSWPARAISPARSICSRAAAISPARSRARRSASTTTGFRRCTVRCTGRRRSSTSPTPARSCSAAMGASPTRFGRSAQRSEPTARFEADFAGVDLAALTDFEQLKGLRFAGTASGERVLLEWPLGRFADHRGSGRLVDDAAGRRAGDGHVDRRRRPQVRSNADRALHEWGPFAPAPLPQHLPVAGELTYRFDPERVDVEPGRFATEHTHVTFQGSTAWGDAARMAFHVTSDDWQESDQVLAGIMTDFGAPTSPVTFGGRGEFDGMMTGPFRRPRVEGEFTRRGSARLRHLVGRRHRPHRRRERLCHGARRPRPPERLGDALRRLVLARFPARRWRRGDQRADPGRAARYRLAAPRVRDRRISRLGPAVGRVPSDRRVPAAGRLRRHDARQSGRLRRAVCKRRPRRCGSTAPASGSTV